MTTAPDRSGMVFQAHNLFTHMTVLQNITAGPTLVQRRERADAENDAMDLLRMVGLSEKADQYPHQLSGGAVTWWDRPGASDQTQAHALR